MITPDLSLKKALLFSLVFHFILVIITLPRFHRKPMRYWMATPVELVSLPPADTAVTQPAKPVAPVREKQKPKEEKKAKEKKAEVKKDMVVIKPKKKKADEKPQPPLKENIQPVSAAAPAAPAAAAPAQATVIVPDVNDFPFLYYLNIIQKNVSANWNFEYEGTAHQKVVVFFKIDKNGKVYDSKVEKSSGISFLDQSALRAVLLSSPFPPLPDEYNGSFLGIHFGFEFKKEG